MKCTSSYKDSQNLSSIPVETLEKTGRHPCYYSGAHHQYARMHLPVAPACNISCNYCNRKFDCLHESRPGVTSELLIPAAALEKYLRVKEKIENLSVIGIAGPGDALANWKSSKTTIKMIKEVDPDAIFCLSTNGLVLPAYAEEILDLGVRHVTVTVNCLEPEIGAKIYKYVRYQGQKYYGAEGAKILIRNQLAGIAYLARHGVLIKVNIVMIKGINDSHIPKVVKKVKELGAFLSNIMPLIPAQGSSFENFPQTSNKEINQLRKSCEIDLQQMYHCRQCRADAIGLLGNDRSAEFSKPVERKVVAMPVKERDKMYTIAVATKYGKLVDQHFGYASEFGIYKGNGKEFEFLEHRQVEKYCAGVEECDSEEARKDSIAEAIKDCNAVLTMRIGYYAKQRLAQKGILSVEFCDTIENGLVYAVAQLINNKVKAV